MGYNDAGLKALVGKKITKVEMSEDYLVFHAGDESFVFDVEGDCCSHSYFYDIYGIDKLINNGPVVSTAEIALGEPDDEDSRKGDVVAAYGFEIVTEHPKWGPQTTALSFRNDSNGYYGGWMNGPSDHAVRDELADISDKDWYVAQ